MDEVIDRDNPHYKAKYGDWAGNPRGHKPDFTRCCVEVTPNERGGFAHRHQCNNKRGHGPGSAYCAVHDPEKVNARKAKATAAHNARFNAERYQWHGKAFFAALEQIANGHNDARGLAAEVIAEFKAGEH